MIIFPAIDLRQGRVVRLRQGRADAETVFADDPLQVAGQWEQQGAAWLHVVNLDGAFGQQSPNLAVVRDIVAAVGIPVQFGGGLRDLAAVAEALRLGVARVILGTVAVRQPEVVAEAVRRFGAERIVVGIDARDGRVAVHGWTEVSAVEAAELGRRMAGMGVRRAVYTDVSRDGMLTGVNVEATAALARATGLRVIASGGVASLDDIRRLKAVEPDGVEGVIIGQALYAGAVGLGEAIEVGKDCSC